MLFAVLGVLFNLLAALATRKGESFNQKTVNLHMLEDTFSWIAVLIGAIVMKRKNYKRPPVKPMLYVGQQEYGFRPGTTPVAMVAALAKACPTMKLMDWILEQI